MGPSIGLIAGGGRLPLLTARGIHEAGGRVIGVGLAGYYEPEFPTMCDEFRSIGMPRPSNWARFLRGYGVERAVMIGKVSKLRMYDPFIMFRNFPDLVAVRAWYTTLRRDRRTDKMLGFVAGYLAGQGVRLIDSTQYIKDQLAGEGVMTRAAPSASQLADIKFALPIASRLGEVDVGQSVAVKDSEIIAVEAIEGTDSMIERAGALCRAGKWTLVKLAKPAQDMRFDVPTVGPGTIKKMKEAGGTCLALEAGKVIIVDKVETLVQADRAGIAVVGVLVTR